MKRVTRTSVIVVAIVAASSLCVALGGHPGWEGHGGPGPGPGMMGPGPGGPHGGGFGQMLLHRADELGLTDEQQASIEAIIDEERANLSELHEQLETARKERWETLDPGEFDEAEVRAFAQEQAKLMTEVMVASARERAKLYSVLTSEQQSQLKELQEQAKACHQDRGKRGHRGR